MRRFEQVMHVVNWLLILVVAVLGLWAFVFDISGTADKLLQERVPRGILGLFSLVLIFVELIWMWGSVQGRMVTFTNERGQIKVSTGSLEKSLARAVLGQSEVESASVRIAPGPGDKGPIHITASIAVRECPDLLGVQGTIQTLLEARFNEMLETGRPKKYNVVITRLKHRRDKDKQPVPEDFTGPQFPVRDNGDGVES